MLKNRTLIGIVLIVAAIGLCFGISPLFNTILASKTTIIRLKQDIPQGVQITGSMLEAVEVGTMNLPADMQNDPKKIIGKYSVTATETPEATRQPRRFPLPGIWLLRGPTLFLSALTLPNRFFLLQLLLRVSSPALWARLFLPSISIVI